MTPTEIKAAFERIGGGANKRLGQHFLIDKAALETIVEAADITTGERVLEIGPGLGVLTRALISRGAQVLAIERDRRFGEYLREGKGTERIEVIQGDAAELDWLEVVGEQSWKLVSNLPYSITSLALRKALWSKNPAKRIVVLIQREVAERAVSLAGDGVARRGGKTSLLSLMIALASKSVEIVRRVPPGAFFPPPKVESAVLLIVPMTDQERQAHWGMDPERVMEVAKRGFAHPRKLLSSNLQIDASRLEQVGVLPKTRAEDVSPEQWVKLARALGR